MNKWIRYVLFLPVSISVSWIAFSIVKFIAFKLISFASAFGLLQNGPIGKVFFGDFQIAILIIGFFAWFVFGYIFVLIGLLIYPAPKAGPKLLFALAALFGGLIFFVDGVSIFVSAVQYLGIVAGAFKAMSASVDAKAKAEVYEN